MIAASIAEETTAGAIAALKRAAGEGADLAEIRADSLRDANFEAIRGSTTLPLILTVRPAWEGGRYRGEEADRVAMMRAGAEAGFEYVDVEFRAYKSVGVPMSRVILSLHDYEGVPPDLRRLVGKMMAMEPFLVKVAVTPRSAREVVGLIDLQRSVGHPLCVVPMGEFAEPMRAGYRAWGAYLTYASVGAPTAPGQPSVVDLRETYGVPRDELWTPAWFAVVGSPIAHSRSPELHNRMFREKRVDARLFRWRVDDPAELPDVLARLAGAAVTIPHKEAVVAHLDSLDADAKRIGAVNTVVRGRGYNTDLEGARAALEAGGVRSGAKALILGAGGTARAFAAALEERGAEVAVGGRTPARAAAIARTVVAWEERASGAFDVVINSTPLGMAPREDESPVPEEFLRAGMVAIDAVYAPPETRFIRAARAAGAVAVPGTVMFEAQAKAQNELFVRSF